jgi:hypothetical protein
VPSRVIAADTTVLAGDLAVAGAFVHSDIAGFAEHYRVAFSSAQRTQSGLHL